jgi:hypothetical protein
MSILDIRRRFQEGGEGEDYTSEWERAVEANRRQETEKGALAQQKFSDYLKEKTGYENIEDYYQDPGYQAYNPRAAEGDITKAIYDAINLQGYKPFGYEDKPFEFGFDQDPNAFYLTESKYDPEGQVTFNRIRPYTSEEKQSLIKNNVENELYRQSLFDPYRFGFSNERQPTIESSKFFLDQLRNLQGRDSDFSDVIKKGNYIDMLESNLRSMYDDEEYQKLQETLDPGYSKYASDSSKINKAFDTSDVLANYDSATGKIDSSIYAYLSDAERNIIEQSRSLPTYLTGYAQQLIQDTRNRKQESDNRANAYAQQFSNLPTTQYSLNDELGFERPQIDPFSGQQVSAQEQAAFTQPQQNIFPQQESTGLNYLMGMPDSDSSSISNLGRQDILNLLTSNFNNLDLQTMNEIRNNPGSFTIENPYLQAARTGIQSLSPGKVMSDVGEGLSTIYHGTADPSKAFSGSKFFATPDYQTALQYAKEGALRGTSIGNATGDVLRATAPTSQIQDLLKRGLTGTREIVLDPQAAQKLFLQGSGNLVETGSLASRLGRKAFQALPAVGAGLAGLDAYQRFNQGDYIGAGLGAASAVPGIGLPATAAQILYDVVYKPNQRN